MAFMVVGEKALGEIWIYSFGSIIINFFFTYIQKEL